MPVKTKLKNKKSSLRESDKNLSLKYRLLMDFMDHIPDVIYFKDRKGRLILVNRAHARGLGLTPDQVAGKTDFDIFPKERAARMSKDDQQVMKTGKSIMDKIERATRADGVDNYVSTTKIPRRDRNGRIAGLIGITRDVTKRMRSEHLHEERMRMEKKLEMLEDLSKIKSDFISAVSHELRTPLAIIKQLLSLIFDETAGPLNNQQREILVRARKNIERLTKIIDELLDISRIEGKRLKLHYSLVNLNDLLRDTEDFFKKLAAEKNIKLNYLLPSHEVNIFIDVERIVQVVSNLINNAIKFTEENGTITVEVKILENKIRIGVMDTGIGIAQVDLGKIFDKFAQVSRDSSEKKGIGLGLTIVKELVERHGGEIWVESKLGVGSKFYFTIPRFYTAKMLGKNIKDKIEKLLAKKVPIYLINLLMVNYEEFRKRIDISSARMSGDLKSIIHLAFGETYPAGSRKNDIYITDMHKGKYNIIFPESREKNVSRFFESLKKKIKDYFVKHKVDDVFIALGILTYSAKNKEGAAWDVSDNVNIKEIYIGSEMRRAKRINYQTAIEVVSPSAAAQLSETVDISHKGICFLSKNKLKTDSVINIRFELLRKKETVSAQARVAWLQKLDGLPGDHGGRYKTGLEFVHLGEKDQGTLEKELKLYYE
ncbi:MAG: ATP-binding protein [Candidatus Omnitrophota bacterium]